MAKEVLYMSHLARLPVFYFWKKLRSESDIKSHLLYYTYFILWKLEQK